MTRSGRCDDGRNAQHSQRHDDQQGDESIEIQEETSGGQARFLRVTAFHGEPHLWTGLLLQTKQHQNLALPFRQRLKCFPDECAGPVNLHSADIDRLRLHCDTGRVARDQ